MAAGALPLSRLISELYGKHVGNPCLVVAGGPSAPAQYAYWLEFMAMSGWIIIAANDHAFRMGITPTYVFCKDDEDTSARPKKVKMEPRVRRGVIPVIGRHFWTDYRAPRWPVSGNSGQMAIGTAALMCCPLIIPIGFDCFEIGKSVYFDRDDPKNVSVGRPPDYWKGRYERLSEHLEGAVVRTLGGPLTKTWPKYHPAEQLPAARIPGMFTFYRDMQTHMVKTNGQRAGVHFGHVPLPPSAVVAVDTVEKEQILRLGLATSVC